jgi:apolipoprotein N-acyltransferase
LSGKGRRSGFLAGGLALRQKRKSPFGRVLSSSRLMTRTVLTETIYPSARLSLNTRIGDALPIAGLTLSLLSFILTVT